jgi:hypothetical protein
MSDFCEVIPSQCRPVNAYMPTVVYGCETRSFTLRKVYDLKVCEILAVRRIFVSESEEKVKLT